jgi:hypothetical protein
MDFTFQRVQGGVEGLDRTERLVEEHWQTVIAQYPRISLAPDVSMCVFFYFSTLLLFFFADSAAGGVQQGSPRLRTQGSPRWPPNREGEPSRFAVISFAL